MTGRPGKKPGALRLAGDPEQAGGFRAYLVDFLAWTAARQYSAMTVKARRIELGYFIDWCEERSIRRPDEVTRAMLERYRQHVYTYRRKTDGAPLSHQTQAKRLISVRAFFQWLARQHHLLYNPASELELPKQQQRLPRHILSVAEVEQVLNACDTQDPLGLRDRAMLETLYSTGMRRAEITGLRVDDDGALFLAKHGAGMQAKQLSVIVRSAIAAANLERFADTHPNAACHLLRHACATHMLENGADIRYIQALLGHADLSTTEVYTRVSIQQLKAVHEKTHPARMPGSEGARTHAVGLDPADAAGGVAADA